MTDLNRRAGELGEYGDDPNENGTPADPEADAADVEEEPPPVAPAVQPAREE